MGWSGPIADETWFDFDTIPLPALSSAGTAYFRRIRSGMPRIPAEVINSVFYLYHSREEAEAGKPFGGTGFLSGLFVGELLGGAFGGWGYGSWGGTGAAGGFGNWNDGGDSGGGDFGGGMSFGGGDFGGGGGDGGGGDF
jgi:hypothetical protein